MAQAAQWIASPEIKISALFLSPDDTSYSAFRLLDVALTHRPTLPVYILDTHLQSEQDSAKRLIHNTHIHGVFSGNEKYETLVAKLNVTTQPGNIFKVARTPAPAILQHPGFVALPISDFNNGTTCPFTLFLFNGQDRPILFAQAGSMIDPDYLSQAALTSPYLYVREEEVASAKIKLKKARSLCMEDQDFPTAWKSAEIMVAANHALNEMRQSGVNDQLLDDTQGMLKDLFSLISTIKPSNGELHSLIERAKVCDRSMFCASWSMLVCKQLGYEREATLEILGLASVLQDLSLYRTPHGDLSKKLMNELNPEELKYYLRHPILSADLISNSSWVPEVTLQVVKHHHERRDKTGFPNRLGGAQVHSMAEILSLINSYYEITKAQADDALIIQSLQSGVFAHYSESIVYAFKLVLGTVLKDKIASALDS